MGREMGRSRQRMSELLGDQIEGVDARTQRLRFQELASQNATLLRHAAEAEQELLQLKQQLTTLVIDLEAAHSVNRSLMTELNRART